MEKQNIIALRASEFLLDRTLAPSLNSQWKKAFSSNDLIEACGIIPDFFLDACIRATHDLDGTLSAVAQEMDRAYQMGGFGSYTFTGELSADGLYTFDAFDEHQDPPLQPYARFRFKNFECFVYPYAITAIRDIDSGESMAARFD
jgi:hypothetical protein